MRKTFFILLCLAVSGLLRAAPLAPQDTEKRTSSGMPVRYRAGTPPRPGSFEFIRELDRELTRLFRAPGGAGACVILVDRAHPADRITTRVRHGRREILLGEDFAAKSEDPAFRAELAAHILAARFGLPERFRPLPGWIALGLDGIRQNSCGEKQIIRRKQDYPVLRGLLGMGIRPDFRALMKIKDPDFTGSEYPAVCEFGRFLLETFARVSTLGRNALGDYAAGMLKGELAEAELYRTFLLPAITGGGRSRPALTEEEFFRTAAELAAFNYRTPRPAEDLLRQLPEVLKFSVVGADGKPLAGTAGDLPALLQKKLPEAVTAQQQIIGQLQLYGRAFSPEVANDVNPVQAAVARMSGKSPEAECAALKQACGTLEKRLAEWGRVEAYLEDCERKFVNPCLRFRAELSTVSEPDEFLTSEERAFFDEVGKKYLEN